MNGKAHNFVFCNWLVMSSKEKMIRNKCLKIYKAYLYGRVEELVMFTLIYFKRSQHAFSFQGTFNAFLAQAYGGLSRWQFLFIFSHSLRCSFSEKWRGVWNNVHWAFWVSLMSCLSKFGGKGHTLQKSLFPRTSEPNRIMVFSPRCK